MDEPKIFNTQDDDNTASDGRNLHGLSKGINWAWFSGNMATGSLAILLYQTPYKFRGLITIGKVVFILDLVSFLILVIMMAVRFVRRPKALMRSLRDRTESFYFGTFWVSVALILSNASIYGSSVCGPWLVKVIEVLFWCHLACVIVVAIFHYQALFVSQNLPISTMTPSWILPIYPLLITGPLAATLIQHQRTCFFQTSQYQFRFGVRCATVSGFSCPRNSFLQLIIVRTRKQLTLIG